MLGRLRALPRGCSASPDEVIAGWPDPEQGRAALDSLIRDGLVRAEGAGFVL